MKYRIVVLSSVLLTLISCNPKLTSSIVKSYPPLDYKENVYVIGVDQPEPSNSQFLGELKIGDSGFSTNCSYEVVLDKAKLEARKAGGNVIKVTEHIPPTLLGSSCHRIKARILKVENTESLASDEQKLLDVDYAILNVYRYSGVGPIINYDLHLGDSVICRVRNNYKTTIHVKKDGLTSLWAKTESKAEIPIDLKPGKEYFLRCSVAMGAFVGRPKLEMVDWKTGKMEFESFKAKNQ